MRIVQYKHYARNVTTLTSAENGAKKFVKLSFRRILKRLRYIYKEICTYVCFTSRNSLRNFLGNIKDKPYLNERL